MSLPTDTPTAFQVARVELKKTLEPKDGKPAATILKLGLIAPDKSKGWVEMFERDPARFPKEGSTETLILSQPENPEWALKAARPRSGGFKGRSPAETKRIERMHAQEMSIRVIALRAASVHNDIKDWDDGLIQDAVRKWTDWFVEDTAS